MYRSIFILTSITLLFAFLLSSQRFIVDKQASEIRLGAVLCLTGECAEWGESSRRGIILAVEEINSQGGVLGRKLRAYFVDSGESTSTAKTLAAFRRLRSLNNIDLFVGPTWTPAGQTLAPVLAKMPEVLMTSPSLGLADFNETADNLFNTWPHDKLSTEALANYAISKGYSTASIFSSQQPWEKTQGEVFEKAFSKHGKVLEHVAGLPKATDIKPEALRIANSKPEVVFLSNTNRLGQAARELRKLGYSGPLLAVLLDRTRLIDAQGALDGAVTALYPESSKDFQSRHFKRFGQQAGISADTAYDSVMLYAKAIKEAGSISPKEIKQSLKKLKHKGASGDILFDHKGGVLRKPVLQIARGQSLSRL